MTHIDWPLAQPGTLAPEEIHAWAWTLDGEEPETSLLDQGERARLDRFRFPRDRIRYAAAHHGLRRILGGCLQQPPASLQFSTGPFGKPELAGIPSPLRFNLSHSADVALLAIASGSELGVDVEAIRPIEAEVAGSHFSPRELGQLGTLAGNAWLPGFYACWTRKEAILKAEGAGLNLPLDAFDVSLLPGRPAALLGVREPIRFRHAWKLHSLTPAEGMAAAVATSVPAARIRCFQLPRHPAS